MADPRAKPQWRSAVDLPLIVLATATVLSLIRSIDQPSFTVDVAGSEITFVLADAALAVLAGFCLHRLLGSGSLPRPARALAIAAAAFSAWLFLSSAANGATAVIAAAKLLEYGVLALGLRPLRAPAAAALAARGRPGRLHGRRRRPTACSRSSTRRSSSRASRRAVSRRSSVSTISRRLSTMTLAVALAALFAPRHRLGRLPLVAGIAGAIGVVLGAAVAGLLGLYLAVGAILAVGVARKAATKRAVVVTLAVTAAITIGVLSLRSGDLGAFLRSVGIGEKREDTFGNAASWNERLIDAYIGGRIFLDNPIVGTGWHGELPPEEYVRFLDDARARFPDQPATYFPSEDGVHPAADLRPGAVRARDRRCAPVPRPRLRDGAHGGARGPDLAARRPGRAGGLLAGGLGRPHSPAG